MESSFLLILAKSLPDGELNLYGEENSLLSLIQGGVQYTQLLFLLLPEVVISISYNFTELDITGCSCLTFVRVSISRKKGEMLCSGNFFWSLSLFV